MFSAGQFWTVTDSYGQFWTVSDSFGQFRTVLDVQNLSKTCPKQVSSKFLPPVRPKQVLDVQKSNPGSESGHLVD